MAIAGVGTTLVRLLREGYDALHGGSHGALGFELFTTSSFENTPTDKVSLFLFRVEVDPTRRHRDIPPATLGAPAKVALAVDLRYLLTVWVSDAEREHQILQDCIEILDRNAIVSGVQLDPAYDWEPGAALKVMLDALSHEDMMRLWDLLEPTYRLSVPYLVRTVTLTPVAQPDAPPVLSRTNILTQGVP